MLPHIEDVTALGHDLERLEARLLEVAACEHGFLTDITTYLARAGGKRLRPTLSMLTAYTRNGCDVPAPDAVIESATAVELLHLGSLYHDDVMDEADMRRSVPSANARWDNGSAVLGGDILLARANNLSCRLGAEEGILAASTLDALCTGQALETRDKYDTGRSLTDYFETIAGKTAAALTAAACRFGALGASMEPALVETFTTIGHHYGMAFQVVDDILDVVSTEEALGKPTGQDLREGVYTLPILVAFEHEPRLREALGPEPSPEVVNLAIKSVRRSGAVEASHHVALQHIKSAQALLQGEAGALDPVALDALLRIGDRILAPVGDDLREPTAQELDGAAPSTVLQASMLARYLTRA